MLSAPPDRTGLGGSWEHVDGKLKNVSVSANGQHVWGVNAGTQIYHRAGRGGSWTVIPGGLKQVEVSGCGNHVAGTNDADDIYYRHGVAGDWTKLPGKLHHVSVSGDGRVYYGVNASNEVYTFERSTGPLTASEAQWAKCEGGLIFGLGLLDRGCNRAGRLFATG